MSTTSSREGRAYDSTHIIADTTFPLLLLRSLRDGRGTSTGLLLLVRLMRLSRVHSLMVPLLLLLLLLLRLLLLLIVLSTMTELVEESSHVVSFDHVREGDERGDADKDEAGEESCTEQV